MTYDIVFPTGLGTKVCVHINPATATATATVLDVYTGESVQVTPGTAAIADAFLDTWFLEPVTLQVIEDARYYAASESWTPQGWRQAFGSLLQWQVGGVDPESETPATPAPPIIRRQENVYV